MIYHSVNGLLGRYSGHGLNDRLLGRYSGHGLNNGLLGRYSGHGTIRLTDQYWSVNRMVPLTEGPVTEGPLYSYFNEQGFESSHFQHALIQKVFG